MIANTLIKEEDLAPTIKKRIKKETEKADQRSRKIYHSSLADGRYKEFIMAIERHAQEIVERAFSLGDGKFLIQWHVQVG
jgi:hypothetical protein